MLWSHKLIVSLVAFDYRKHCITVCKLFCVVIVNVSVLELRVLPDEIGNVVYGGGRSAAFTA